MTPNLFNPYRYAVAGGQGLAWVFGGTGGTSDNYGYNGSSWDTLANYPASVSQGLGGGGADSGISMGGGYSNTSYIYTGASDSWGSNIGLSYSAGYLGGGGLSTNAIAFGGTSTGSNEQSTTAEYLGSSWSNVGNLPSTMMHTTGNGDSDLAIQVAGAFTGHVKTDISATWDGSSNAWSSSTVYPLAVNVNSYAGTVDDGVGWCGHDGSPYGSVDDSFTLSGTTWTTTGNYPVDAYGTARAGADESQAIGEGGEISKSGGALATDACYLYDGASNTWGALGANLPVARYTAMGDGEVV